MRNLNVMLKPASSGCNMKCKYCFYHDVATHRDELSYGIMNASTVNAVIAQTLSFCDGGTVTYAFQGGEPTLAGLDFFADFVTQVEKLNVKHSRVNYALQTNGTLLTDEFCDFFHKHNFLIGISLDGKSDVHNANRLFADGKGTFNKVMQAIDMLNKAKVEFNILTVTTKLTAKNAVKIYNFFLQHNFKYLQFITCLEPFGVQPFSTPYAMNNDEWYQLNKTLFQLYYADNLKGNQVSIRYFDNLISILNGGQGELCGMAGHCGGQLIIESNGNCYPCDFYCDSAHVMGNINVCTLEEIMQSQVMKDFIYQSYAVDDKCKTCSVYNICRGGCRRERDYDNNGQLHSPLYCEGRKKFFTYLIDNYANRR